MQTAKAGDRVKVHYLLKGQDGSQSTSHGKAPLELTVGVEDRHLPGLGLALVGLAPGESATLDVPPEKAFGPAGPARVRRWSRTRFSRNAPLLIGSIARATDRCGRRKHVRVLQVDDNFVVVDANHRWAGQTMHMEVELVAIGTARDIGGVG